MAENVTLTDILNAVESLRTEVTSLSERVSALEAEQGLDEELVAVLSAAIAGYLGVKPKIKQIRLLGSATWAQHGRATIQASHAFKHS